MTTTPHIHSAEASLASIEIKGMTREAFLLRSTLAAGAVYGMGMIGPFVRKSIAQEHMGDVEILNFALTLEHLETAFYERAIEQAKLDGDLRELAEEFGEQESQHVEALTGLINDMGGTPAEAPDVKFPMSNRAMFLELAVTLEDTGVYAYNGAAPEIESTDVLAAAGSIVQIEARHAAAVRLLAEQEPAPDAFDKTLEMQEVLSAVKPFIKS